MSASAFIDLGLIILVAVGVSLIMNWLRQPTIIGYLITGILVGPLLLNLVSEVAIFDVLASIGVSLLLFMVGLGLNPATIREVGKVSTLSGVGQVIFTVIGGFIIAQFLGFGIVASLYIAIALTFSSTIIIMKLVSDRNDIDSLYGKISVGFLIVQDIIAMFILLMISSSAREGTVLQTVAISLAYGIGLLILLYLVSKYLLPIILNRLAKSQEELLLFSMGWCIAIASAFFVFGFSIEVGALLAGVALAASPYRQEISSKMKSLRDFFLLLFFVVLGSQMEFSALQNQWGAIIIFSLFILIGNPVIVMIIMGVMGYAKRTSFQAGLTVAQISEFSFILIALGISVGHLGSELLSFITVVGLITIAGSSYMIMHSDKLYKLLGKPLSIFEKSHITEANPHQKGYEVIVFGHNRLGNDLVEHLRKKKKRYLVVDFDPERIRNLQNRGINCTYGDAGDVELLDLLQLQKAKMVVSTIPSTDINKTILSHVTRVNEKALIVCMAHTTQQAVELYEKGATYVILPHFLGGRHAALIIEKNGFNRRKFLQERINHLNHLKKMHD